jgi:hypothetical protein
MTGFFVLTVRRIFDAVSSSEQVTGMLREASLALSRFRRLFDDVPSLNRFRQDMRRFVGGMSWRRAARAAAGLEYRAQARTFLTAFEQTLRQTPHVTRQEALAALATLFAALYQNQRLDQERDQAPDYGELLAPAPAGYFTIEELQAAHLLGRGTRFPNTVTRALPDLDPAVAGHVQAIQRHPAFMTDAGRPAGRPITDLGVLAVTTLSALGTAAYLSVKSDDVLSALSEVSSAIRAEGAMTGLHCCGNADWEMVLSGDIDILNFDAWGFASKLAIYPGPIKTFLNRGGVLAWGIVPTNQDIDVATEETIADELDRAVAEFVSRGVDKDQLCRQSILTPSCGCGSLTVDQTEKAFALLTAAGEHWRSKMCQHAHNQ